PLYRGLKWAAALRPFQRVRCLDHPAFSAARDPVRAQPMKKQEWIKRKPIYETWDLNRSRCVNAVNSWSPECRTHSPRSLPALHAHSIWGCLSAESLSVEFFAIFRLSLRSSNDTRGRIGFSVRQRFSCRCLLDRKPNPERRNGLQSDRSVLRSWHGRSCPGPIGSSNRR